MEDTKCLAELDEILNYLSKEELEKIPQEVREAIAENKDKKYIWKYDESKELKNQNLNRKTIAMLSYINMKYLLNEEQKKIMQEIHRNNERKLEEEKSLKYKSDNLFEKNNKFEEIALTKINQEKWYKKIMLYIKNIFNK